MAGRDPVAAGGERKLVTILFADLTGYTALAASLDHEEVYRFLRPAMASLQRIVEDFGGTVPQVMGDGFMAVFGVPLAHEDDAERAVRSALAVRDHVRELNAVHRTIPFPEVHAGVNSGEVTVGPSGEQAGFAVVGDTVNTASRLADLAPAGRVLVDETTRNRTAAAIRYGQRRERPAKGKGNLVAFEALGIRATVPARPARPRSPVFVDRTDVVQRLDEEAQAAERTGRSRVLVVTGEPGVGKSRLAAEYRRRIARGPVLSGRCAPFGQRLPLHALAEAIGAAAGVPLGGPPERIDDAIRLLVERVGDGALPRTLPRDLRLLLGTEPARAGHQLGSSRDAVRAARTVVERLATGGPVTVVLDDLHWADPDLIEVLRAAHRSPWSGPVVLLGLGRAGGMVRDLPRIELALLKDGDMRALARQVLGSDVPGQVLDVSVARAGGNPLFLEESIGMLVEGGALRAEAGGWSVADPERLRGVPSTIRLLIAARLDGLPPEEKRILQCASVCGERTWDLLIERLADVPDTRGRLGALRDRDLLRGRGETAIRGATEFEFKHVLIRDVAYQSLPRAERATLHLQVAEWLRERARGEPVEMLADVANHSEQAWHLGLSRTGPAPAGSTARLAVGSLQRWADRTLTYQARAAESLYGRALRIADSAGEAVEPASTAAALIGRAESLIEMGRHREAIADAARGRAIAEAAGEGRLVARALLSLGRSESDLGRMTRARALLQEARARFDAEGDVRGQGWALHRLSETWGRADYGRELDDLREAHRLFARSRDRWGRAIVAQDLAYLLTMQGGSEFHRWYAEARKLVEDEGDLRSRAGLLRTWGYYTSYRGEHGQALRAMREARPIAVEAGDRYTEADALLIGATSALFASGPEESERMASEALDLARELQSSRIRAMALFAGAGSAMRAGDPARAARRMRTATAVVRREGIRVMSAEVRLTEAGLNLDRGAWDQVPACLRAVGRQLRANGWTLWEPLPHLLRGRALLQAGRNRAAARELIRSTELARSVHADGWLALAEACREQAAILLGAGPTVIGDRDEPEWEVGAVRAENAGLLALRAGDPRGAVDALGRAIEVWERLGTTAWLARSLALRARALERAGNRRAASAAAARSRRVLDSLRTPARDRASILSPALD